MDFVFLTPEVFLMECRKLIRGNMRYYCPTFDTLTHMDVTNSYINAQIDNLTLIFRVTGVTQTTQVIYCAEIILTRVLTKKLLKINEL